MKNPKVYVLYPKGVRTGGPEALHQLVHGLRALGVPAALVPHPDTVGRERVTAYRRYDAPEARLPRDVAGSVVIAPEIHVRELDQFREARTFCWWLSIDNSPLFRAERRFADWRAGLADPWRLRDAKSALDLVRRGMSRWRLRLRRSEHLAQSEYARLYLADRLGIDAASLSDYLPTNTTPEFVQRKGSHSALPRVAYNPAKGARLTDGVIAAMGRDVTWDPISGLSHEGVTEHLSQADVYMDLGPHPGRDRMPREAALSGAVTIVARRGSGALPQDVPIPDGHKVSVVQTDPVAGAVEVLRRVMNNADQAFRDQAPYRRWIAGQEDQFRVEVEQLAERLEQPRGWV